jgi:D-3-phosphoglycerate dehydrogenase
MSRHALLTDPVAGDVSIEADTLAAIGLDLEVAPSSDEETLIALVADAEAILVTYAQVTAGVIAAAAHCRVIARFGIGIDNIDIGAASAAGIVVTNVPDYCLDEVADHALALLLASARGVVAASNRVRDGAWDGGQGAIHRLQGRRLALIGVGAVGRRVATRAQAFGLLVTGFDPYLDPWDLPGVERAGSLEEAVAEADYVSLHSPLTDATRHVIDADLIASMRRAPIIINTARGPLIDHDALAAALGAGTLSGAALDVTEPEPLAGGHPLRSNPRVIMTPHTAFYSVEAGEELRRRAAGDAVRVLSGIAPQNPINGAAVERARAQADAVSP